MKHLLSIVLAGLTFIVHAPPAHALLGHVAAEKSRREHVEQQLDASQQKLGEQQRFAQDQQRLLDQEQQAVVEGQQRLTRWQTTTFVLGVTAIVALVVGTAIGSRGRYHAAAAAK